MPKTQVRVILQVNKVEKTLKIFISMSQNNWNKSGVGKDLIKNEKLTLDLD